MSEPIKHLLNDFSSIIECSLKQPSNDIKEAAHIAAGQLINAYEGQQVYFPKSHSAQKMQLHKKIKADFNGKNQVKLAKRYQLSTVQIYNITRSKT